MAKAKWLESSSQRELLQVINEALYNNDNEKLIKKGISATQELLERTPEGELSVQQIIDNVIGQLNQIPKHFDTLYEVVSDEVEDITEETKEDLSSLSKKDLKILARDYDIKIGKGLSKEEIISLIEEAQKEGVQGTFEELEEEEPDVIDDVEEEEVEEEEELDEEVEEPEDYTEILEELSIKKIKEIALKMGLDIKGRKSKQLIQELATMEGLVDTLLEMGLVVIEEEDDEEESIDVSELSDEEIREYLKDLGYKVKKGTPREEMLELID